MLKIEKVLFPTDFSPCSDQALTHALFLAEQFEATLQLFHAVILHQDDPGDPKRRFPEQKEVLERLFEIAGSELAARVEQHRERPVVLQEFKKRGFSAAQVILDHAREEEVDLIVMGTHGRRGPARLFFGSVAEEVVRFSRAPVLTLRELEEPRTIEAFERILVPIDFSDHSTRALSHARELASLYGARLQLLHVLEQPAQPYFYAPFGGMSLVKHFSELEKRADEALDKLVAECPGPDVPREKRIVSGRPASEIVDFAEQNGSDMIVIATHGLTGLERLLVGSTAEQVVRSSPAPVFLVKSFGKSLLAT